MKKFSFRSVLKIQNTKTIQTPKTPTKKVKNKRNKKTTSKIKE
ncbi:hypothetical protein [Helicobacter pylori]|nr:hypothetical protein [Helicobacter pylori]